MSRPHEETWVAEGNNISTQGPQAKLSIAFCAPDDLGARAQLAAQAPAMARLLLEFQWSDLDIYGDSICPSCGNYRKLGLHAEDCALGRVLRDAGVIA